VSQIFNKENKLDTALKEFAPYITIASFLFGVWQYWRRRKLEELISHDAVELHLNVAQALGSVQSAKDLIQNNSSAVYQIGMVEGYNQALLHGSAKLYCNLKNTSLDDIDNLIKNGQLPDKYRNIYSSYSKAKIGLLRYSWKYLKRIF
jgi:hypothetical protein